MRISIFYRQPPWRLHLPELSHVVVAAGTGQHRQLLHFTGSRQHLYNRRAVKLHNGNPFMAGPLGLQWREILEACGNRIVASRLNASKTDFTAVSSDIKDSMMKSASHLRKFLRHDSQGIKLMAGPLAKSWSINTFKMRWTICRQPYENTLEDSELMRFAKETKSLICSAGGWVLCGVGLAQVKTGLLNKDCKSIMSTKELFQKDLLHVLTEKKSQ